MARSVLSPSFLLHYYGITARYFTLLSYWHQSYCKSKCFILITLLRQGSSPFFLLSIKATVKSKCFILITLLRYYGKVLHSSFLLASKILYEASVSFLLRCYAITQGSSLFFLLSIKATAKSKYFILITLLRYYGKALYYPSFLLASKLLSESN